jgi:hypothetical protein
MRSSRRYADTTIKDIPARSSDFCDAALPVRGLSLAWTLGESAFEKRRYFAKEARAGGNHSPCRTRNLITGRPAFG